MEGMTICEGSGTRWVGGLLQEGAVCCIRVRPRSCALHHDLIESSLQPTYVGPITWDGDDDALRVLGCQLSEGAVCGAQCRSAAIPSSLKLQLTVYSDGLIQERYILAKDG